MIAVPRRATELGSGTALAPVTMLLKFHLVRLQGGFLLRRVDSGHRRGTVGYGHLDRGRFKNWTASE